MKNKFKKLIAALMSAVMIITVLPLQTFAAVWGKGDTVYAALIADYVGSDGQKYADQRNYTYIYYNSNGAVGGTGTRYASTHSKLGVSKNGIMQQAICIEAGKDLTAGAGFIGEDNTNAYMANLPKDVQTGVKLALICGFNSDTTSSPVSGTNLDDFSLLHR